jgi:chromosome segregation ATPase
MADGSIVIAVDADDKEAQKTLSSLTKKIEALEKKISDKTAGRNQLVEQLKAANNEAIDTYNTVERLRKELAESQAKTSVSGPSIDPTQYAEELERQKAISNELKEQEAILAKKESIAERLVEKDSQTVADLERQNEELSRLKEQAGDVQRQMARASKGLSEMPETLNLANKQMNSFVTRIAGLAVLAVLALERDPD